MSFSFDDLLPLFYSQLCHGCNSLSCHTKECRSCPNFIFSENDPSDIDLLCTQLAIEYEENHGLLCKSLSPILLRPQLSLTLINFCDFAQNFVHDEKVTQQIQILNSIFQSGDVFSHIFLSRDGLLRPDDLQINCELCIEFHDALKRRNSELAPFGKSFSRLLQLLGKSSSVDTLHWIRGLIILSVFSPMFQVLHAADNSFNMVFERITKMSCASFQIFFNFIVNNPVFIGYLNETVQMAITAYVSSQSPDPHNPQMHTMASVVELLSEANVMSEKPIPSISFINDSFNHRILPEFEYKLYQKGLFSYLKTPSILDMSFKSLILRQFSRNMGQKSIKIRRDNIVEDAIEKVLKLPSVELQKHLQIQFQGENAQDSGGVSREFFYLLFNEFFSDKYNLFTENENGGFYWFNKRHNQDCVFYQYVGTIVGLALNNSIILPVRFPLLLYKKLYNLPLTLNDFEEFDPSAANSLRRMKSDMKPGDDYFLYFTVAEEGEPDEIEIVPGGTNKKVDSSNIDEYISAIINYHLNESVKKEFAKFRDGFQMSEPHILQSFRFYDLDVLISGTQVLDWGALKTNATYANGYSADSLSVKLFWKIFTEQMDDKKKSLLLQFITGCARAPAGGLEAVNIVIQRSGDIKKLPTSHTCFNTLVLPDYQSETKMRQSLDICTSNAEGFGLI